MGTARMSSSEYCVSGFVRQFDSAHEKRELIGRGDHAVGREFEAGYVYLAIVIGFGALFGDV